jgi:predicted metalloprotease
LTASFDPREAAVTVRIGYRSGAVAIGGLLAMLVTTLGCAVGPAGRERPAPRGPAPSASAGDQVDGTMTVEEFKGDIAGAVRLAEAYWAGRFKESGDRFEPVGQIIAYQRDGEVGCGGQELTRNNAAYCSAGDFIAYDVNWAVAAFRQIGDAFLFYLLGHEYAHGIQVRLGIQYSFTIQQELQADCMAGAYIGDSVRDKSLTLEDGDLDELRRGLLAVGDDPDQPWFAEGAHGTAEQRTDLFFGGYERSLAACGLG